MAKRKSQKKHFVIDGEKFIESIYHIAHFGNLARNLKETYLDIESKISESERNIVRLSFQWQAMVMTISLMDEFNKFLFAFRSDNGEIQKRINQFKHITQPMISEINSWSDLRNFRNNVLAHNFRIDKEGYKSVLLHNRIGSYNIPKFRIDFIILLKYIAAITKICEEIFIDEYNDALYVIEKFSKAEKRINDIDGKANNANNIIAEVNQRALNYNLSQ
jgi:hypothetical protein